MEAWTKKKSPCRQFLTQFLHYVMHAQCLQLLCLIGNLVQVYQLTSQYTRYRVTTEIEYMTPDFIQTPAVVICFEMDRVIDWNKATAKEAHDWTHEVSSRKNLIPGLQLGGGNSSNIDPHEVSRGIKSLPEFDQLLAIISNFQRRIPIERFFNVTFSLKDIMTDYLLFVDGRKLETKSYDEFLNYVTVIPCKKESVKCFSLNFKQRLMKHADVMDQVWYHGRVMQLKLDPEFVADFSGFALLLSSNNDPYGNGLLLEPWFTIKMNGYRFYYDTAVTELLEEPFTTGCMRYDRQGINSKGRCHDDCLRERGLANKMLRSIPQQATMYESDRHAMVTIWDQYYNQTVMGEVRRLNEQCSRICWRHDCSSVMHYPVLEVNVDYFNITYIRISIGSRPVTSITAKPAISMVSFLTDLFSTFGFWIGLSVLDSLTFFADARSRLMSRKSKD